MDMKNEDCSCLMYIMVKIFYYFLLGSTMTSAKLASLTKLPPSPELKGIAVLPSRHGVEPEQLLLPGLETGQSKRRLLSIARYQPFQPQALACSSRSTDPPSNDFSLGAVAGSEGIAVFRIVQPQTPLLILSRHNVSHLSFSPASTHLLATSRKASIFVWDVSGHSLSPLQGRLAAKTEDATAASSRDITSLSWANSNSLLAATTESFACVWDIRNSQSSFRPSLRFGVSSSTTAPATAAGSPHPYIQIACGAEDECAVLDSSGVVRVFDVRVSDRARWSQNVLAQFQACQHAGVGLAHFGSTGWVTWGKDDAHGDAICKVWKKQSLGIQQPAEANSADTSVSDDYWFMDGSPTTSKFSRKSVSSGATSGKPEYMLAGECTTSGLACARVCPSPIDDSLVTVGLTSPVDSEAVTGWQADLWKLTEDASLSKLKRKASVKSTEDSYSNLRSVVGDDPAMYSLRAAEVVISSYGSGPDVSDEIDNGLTLCCLTANGFVTTHVRIRTVGRSQLGFRLTQLLLVVYTGYPGSSIRHLVTK